MKVQIEWGVVLDVERAFSDMFARSQLGTATLGLNIKREEEHIVFEAFTPYAYLRYPVAADITEFEEESITVGLDSFVGICSYGVAEGSLDLSIHRGKCRLSINGSKYDLPLLPNGTAFMSGLPTMEQGELISSLSLAESLNKVVHFVAKDDNRLTLQNVLIEPVGDSDIRMVATDGSTLFMHENPGILSEKISLQPHITKQFIRLLRTLKERECYLYIDSNFLWFMWDDTIMSIRLTPVKFPDYRKLYPANQGKLIVMEREALLNAIRRINMACPTAKTVKMTCAPSMLTLTTESEKADAYEEVSGETDHREDHGPYYFNFHNLLKSISKMEGEELALRFYGGKSPLLIQDKSRSRSLLAPMTGP
ncbi:MAG: hypothetical protein DRI65_10185 [Chloroflexota bacterium]|nr:MAG: hypothetical protein DRI65_10185 [Chloroflexota bacterium]